MLLPQAHLHAHGAVGPDPAFVMKVTTTVPDEIFGLQLGSHLTYNAQVDWGDGNQSTITAFNDADRLHYYATPGTHEIRVTGDLPWIRYINSGSATKIVEISNFGDNVIDRFQEGFADCRNSVLVAQDPFVPGYWNLSYCFHDGPRLQGVGGNWDFSAVTNMYRFMQFNAEAHSMDSSGWVLNAVTNAREAFYGVSQNDFDVSAFGLANLSQCNMMFSGCALLDSDMSAWNLANISESTDMFNGCTGMSQANVDSLLLALYTHRNSFTWSTPALDISDMATPSGVYQYATPPTTGLEYAYWLEQDPEAEGFNTWTLTI